jgi:hypothetical protein
MTPAFRNVESRSMIPVFHETAARVCPTILIYPDAIVEHNTLCSFASNGAI